jgi:predicted DNA-binding protein
VAYQRGDRLLVNVYLDPKTYAALKALCAQTERPLAYYLRKGAELVLAKEGAEQKSRKGARK